MTALANEPKYCRYLVHLSPTRLLFEQNMKNRFETFDNVSRTLVSLFKD